MTNLTTEQTAAAVPTTPQDLGGMDPIPPSGRAGDWAAFARVACEYPVNEAHFRLVFGTDMPRWEDLSPATRRAFSIAADAAAGAGLRDWATGVLGGPPKWDRLMARRREAASANRLRAMSPPDRAYAAFVAHRVPGDPRPAPTAWRASWAAFAAALEAGARPSRAYAAYVALAPAHAVTPLPWGKLLPSTRASFRAAASAVAS